MRKKKVVYVLNWGPHSYYTGTYTMCAYDTEWERAKKKIEILDGVFRHTGVIHVLPIQYFIPNLR